MDYGKGIIFDANVNGKVKHFSFTDRTAFFEAVENGQVPYEIHGDVRVFYEKIYGNGRNFLDELIWKLLNTKLDKQEIPIFFDMDGALVERNYLDGTTANIDEVMSLRYFQYLMPMGNMIQAARELMAMGHPVYITSKVISGTTAEDKNIWLDQYFPQIKKENRFFIPYGNEDKNAFPLEGGVRPYYVLVDDSTHYRLHGWNGVEIKVDNGINNTERSWRGYMVSSQSYSTVISTMIDAIATLEASTKRSKTMIEKVFLGIKNGLVSIVYGREKGNGCKLVVCCKIGKNVFPFPNAPYTDMNMFDEDYSNTRIAAEITRFLKTPSDYLDETVRKECLREFGVYENLQ